MIWFGGFIPIIIYGGFGEELVTENPILTESSLDIQTETSLNLLTE